MSISRLFDSSVTLGSIIYYYIILDVTLEVNIRLYLQSNGRIFTSLVTHWVLSNIERKDLFYMMFFKLSILNELCRSGYYTLEIR